MNTIATFRKCTLSDEELVKKVDKITDEIYKSESHQVPTMHIPARPDEDYDLLIGELVIRFRELIKPKEAMRDADCKEDSTGKHLFVVDNEIDIIPRRICRNCGYVAPDLLEQ